jgi:hypothetical protein
LKEVVFLTPIGNVNIVVRGVYPDSEGLQALGWDGGDYGQPLNHSYIVAFEIGYKDIAGVGINAHIPGRITGGQRGNDLRPQ